MKIIIPGDPVPWARARIGNAKRFWDSQKQIKLGYVLQISNQVGGLSYTQPLHLDIVFFMPIAESLSDKKKHALDGAYHASKPDLDNLIKFVLDVCTGVLYKNDCIIASISASKKYSLNPRTEFSFFEAKRSAVAFAEANSLRQNTKGAGE